MNQEPVYNNAGKLVGHIETRWGKQWIVKRGLDPLRHKLMQPPGWATDNEHVVLMRERPLAGMILQLTTGQTIWSATADWLDKGGPVGKRGLGKQTHLIDKFWHTGAPAIEQPRMAGL